MTADSARGNSPAISNNISEVVVKNKSHQRKRREVLTNSILRSEIYSVILFTDSFFSHHLQLTTTCPPSDNLPRCFIRILTSRLRASLWLLSRQLLSLRSPIVFQQCQPHRDDKYCYRRFSKAPASRPYCWGGTRAPILEMKSSYVIL